MSFRDYRVDFLYSIRSFCSAEFDAWSSVVRFQQEGRFSFIKYPFMSKKLRGKQSETERTCILDVRSYIFVEVSISFSLGLNSFVHLSAVSAPKAKMNMHIFVQMQFYCTVTYMRYVRFHWKCIAAHGLKMLDSLVLFELKFRCSSETCEDHIQKWPQL